MAATISDVPALLSSLVNPGNSSVSLDSTKVLAWKCACGGVWKESVKKRSGFDRCPRCEPAKGRAGKSTHEKPAPSPVKRGNGVVCEVCMDEVGARDICKCPVCDYGCCKGCLKNAILASPLPAKCLNQLGGCEKPFSNAFMVKTLTKKWYVNEYQALVRKALIQKELSLIPDTMRLVEVMKELGSIDDKINILCSQQLNRERDSEEWMRLDIKINELGALKEAHRLYAFKYPSKKALQGTENAREVFIQGCPTEGCNGLVNGNYECKVCNCRVCETCRSPIEGKKHVCDAETLASVRSMKGNTKPCPECAAPVYKIDGCNQMFCVVCHTAFDWMTMRIETRVIHNPHYYEWLRSGGKELVNEGPGNECGIIWNTAMSTTLYRAVGQYRHQRFGHMHDLVTNEFTIKEDIHHHNMLYRNRAKYIMGKKPRHLWEKHALFYLDMNMKVLTEVKVTMTFAQLMKDIVYPFMQWFIEETRNGKVYKNVVRNRLAEVEKQANELKAYFNQVMIDEMMGTDYDQIHVYNDIWLRVTYRQLRAQLKNPHNPPQEEECGDDEFVTVASNNIPIGVRSYPDEQRLVD